MGYKNIKRTGSRKEDTMGKRGLGRWREGVGTDMIEMHCVKISKSVCGVVGGGVGMCVLDLISLFLWGGIVRAVCS